MLPDYKLNVVWEILMTIALKKLLLLSFGATVLSTSVTAAELGTSTPQWVNLTHYLRLNGTGAVPDLTQLQMNYNGYATVHNNNSSGLTYTAGKVSTALQFDGVDDYIDLGSQPSTANYTILFWAKRSVGTGTTTLFQKGNSDLCLYNPAIHINNATGALSVAESGCGGSGVVGTAITPENEYFHVAVTRSTTAVSFYINGGLVKTLARNNFATGTTKLTLGAASGGSVIKSFFKGAMDDFAIFKTSLTTAEIQSIYQNQSAKYDFESFHKPFRADSFWNSKPVDPVLSNVGIPNIYPWFPSVSNGAWSVPVYNADIKDPPMTVVAKDEDKLLNSQTITIPHWPANVVPASESDGHCDIVDMSTGIIHSFYYLRKNATTGKWTAGGYQFARINGSGFGNPAHYKAGGRASGVTTMAGIIRMHEVDDGADQYNHALAMSLDGDSMIKSTTGGQIFEFPATSDDSNALTSNTMVNGFASTGSLVMLPKTFDLNLIKSPRLKKIAKTLMNYGAYVVDQNTDTPFVIYVENNFTYSNNPTGISPDPVGSDLRTIQYALRRMVNNSGYVDGNGNKFVANKKLNALSMRGEWVLPTGANSTTVGAGFDSYKQAFVFPATAKNVLFNNWYDNKVKAQGTCSWMCLKPGKSYRFKVYATNGAKLQFKIRNNANTAYIFDSGMKTDGQYVDFIMPTENKTLFMAVQNGSIGAAEVRGELIEN